MNPELSVVIPIYNEQAGLAQLFARLYPALDKLATDGISYEIIFVNDGSKDSSLQKLEQLAEKDKNIVLINFSRNFGHHSCRHD